MNIWFLVLIAFLSFAFIAFIRKWHDYSLLFTIAIGFAVNANIYNGITAPVVCGNIVFAVDSILYTGFMFTVIICAREYGVRKAKILTSATIAAILLSAVIEFFAKLSSVGYSYSLIVQLLSYFFSAIGTFAGVWLMLFIYKKFDEKNVNVYLNFTLCVLIASIVNSAVYYGLNALISGKIANFWWILAGSYIGKIVSILLGLLVYFINTHFWVPNDLKEKYPIKPIKNAKKQQKNTKIEQGNENLDKIESENENL